MSTTSSTITTNSTFELTRSSGIPQDISVTGTWGGGSLLIEASLQNDLTYATATRWNTVTTITSTTGITRVCLNTGAILRATLSGATSPSLIVDIL